ncbi:MAG TPA: glycine--tRNA ligase subunit beta, partial [Usitatibacteraceae bacterium]|nr:glycine--tRNA ligase subunit beta [Usitatibacteraceae bacterium]
VRPAHGLVALHGETVVPVSVLGLAAGRTAHGHRFEGAKDIALANADEYAARLEGEGAVIASFAARKAAILALLRDAAAKEGAGLGPEADVETLLDEVTALV